MGWQTNSYRTDRDLQTFQHGLYFNFAREKNIKHPRLDSLLFQVVTCFITG